MTATAPPNCCRPVSPAGTHPQVLFGAVTGLSASARNCGWMKDPAGRPACLVWRTILRSGSGNDDTTEAETRLAVPLAADRAQRQVDHIEDISVMTLLPGECR
jgi:hypothetical protein